MSERIKEILDRECRKTWYMEWCPNNEWNATEVDCRQCQVNDALAKEIAEIANEKEA